MRPAVKRNAVRRAKYRFSWYKSARKMLRNMGRAPTDKAIALG